MHLGQNIITTLYHTSSLYLHRRILGWLIQVITIWQHDRLVNQLNHVNQDTQNEAFLDFMDMVGEQFDETWSYLRHFTDINERALKVSEGISKDIVREATKSMDVVNVEMI